MIQHEMLAHSGFFHFQFHSTSKLLFLKFYKQQTGKPISRAGAAAGTPAPSQVFPRRDVSASAVHPRLELVTNCSIFSLSHWNTVVI